MSFEKFAKAVNDKLNSFKGQELFVTVEPDALWQAYLAAFPEGSNPIYRERTEHDCSCCKNFIRGIGNVVAVIDGKVQSIWNVEAEYPYNVVTEKLAKLVTETPITNLWRTTEGAYGASYSLQRLESGDVKRWHHFFGAVPKKQKSTTPDKDRGNYRTTVEVFRRGLTELTKEALTTVKELIDSNSLYRGQEFRPAVEAFAGLKAAYTAMPAEDQHKYVWTQAESPAARFRNSAIGTLVQDLSEGVDVDKAVRSFEAKVAPANYKRPTAIVTESMVKVAMKAIEDLGVESALHRRHAKISDVTVNNVLWVDRNVKGKMKGGIEATLLSAVTPKTFDDSKAESISVEDFMANVLPKAETLEVMVKNHQLGNLVSITAPQDPEVKQLFKWSNDFAWTYNGGVADSIRERVKAAGGNVDAKLRVSLAWSNYDDLDLWADLPNGERIYYGNKRNILDVDMNAGRGHTREPVENLAFVAPADGKYRIVVNQYMKRETVDCGFTLEIADANGVRQYNHEADLRGMLEAVELTVKSGLVTALNVNKALSSRSKPKQEWGITTEVFTPVETLMLSPNYWDDNAVGNKHWFFILQGCKAPGEVRGIYNEFLNPRLDQHRKVFELLGNRCKCPPSDEQLSGVGFSSTSRAKVTVRVTGSLNKVFNINF